MMPDQDNFWDELLTYIEAHSVIPVIGPELVIVDHQGRLEPYYRLLARELATRLKLDDPGEAATLDQVVGAYLAKPGSRRQSVYRELGDIAGKAPGQYSGAVAATGEHSRPESLRQLLHR